MRRRPGEVLSRYVLLEQAWDRIREVDERLPPVRLSGADRVARGHIGVAVHGTVAKREVVDLAAIPGAMTRGLARELCKRMAAAPDLLGVHQHGSTHLNHESEGRKCEFGPSRRAAQQRDDLARGQAQLAEFFVALLLPVLAWIAATNGMRGAVLAVFLYELGIVAMVMLFGRADQTLQYQIVMLAVATSASSSLR